MSANIGHLHRREQFNLALGYACHFGLGLFVPA
jgi:hypothetical protein